MLDNLAVSSLILSLFLCLGIMPHTHLSILFQYRCVSMCVCVCVCVVLLAHFLLLVQILNEILLFMVHVEQRVETILLQSFFG